MIAIRPYLLLLTAVLLIAGCSQDRSNPSSDAPTPSASETTPSPSSQAGASERTSSGNTSSGNTSSGNTSSGNTSSGNTSSGNASEKTGSTAGPKDESDDAIRVVVLGNSITAGYGLDSPQQAFPALLEDKADALGWNVSVQNAGLSGETSAGGARRISWLLRSRVDVLVLELGGNDGLRGIDLTSTRSNLKAIVDTTLSAYPDARVLLAGIRIPPNLGQEYTQDFQQVFPDVAGQYDRVVLLPRILEGVGGVPELMQSDGIHPTAEGQRRIAETVWAKLKPMLEDVRAARRDSVTSAP